MLEPARKKALWQEKVDHILSLELSKGERQLLAWYAEQFKKFDYNTPTSPEVQEAFHEKTKESMKRFGWSKALVYELFFVLQDVDSNKLGNARVDHFTHAPNEGGGGADDPVCDCTSYWGCPGWDVSCNRDGDCGTTSYTCGFF